MPWFLSYLFTALNYLLIWAWHYPYKCGFSSSSGYDRSLSFLCLICVFVLTSCWDYQYKVCHALKSELVPFQGKALENNLKCSYLCSHIHIFYSSSVFQEPSGIWKYRFLSLWVSKDSSTLLCTRREWKHRSSNLLNQYKYIHEARIHHVKPRLKWIILRSFCLETKPYQNDII